MDNAETDVPAVLEDIFHPSDFSEASEVAFAHALKIALLSGASLHMLHVTGGEEVHWSEFPGIRETLERWGMLPPGSPRHAVGDLGLSVSKVVRRSPDPVAASLEFLNRHPADLIVLATHRHGGRAHWLSPSIAEPIARNAHLPTLFVPHEVEGFVSRADGSVSLRNILVPVDHEPSPTAAASVAARVARGFGLPEVRFTLLHVGDEADALEVQPATQSGWTWETATAHGEVVAAILHAARERQADLIVMATAGHHGFLDALRGSTTERVLVGAPCPLLAVPAGY